MILSWILDMLWSLTCVGPVPKFLHKVTEEIFLYDLSCVIDKFA
jgi:hypothetical protein